MGNRVVRRPGRPIITQPSVQPVRQESGPPKRLWLRRTIVGILVAGLLVLVTAGLRVREVVIEPADYQELLQEQADKLINDRVGWSHMLVLPSAGMANELEEANKVVITGVKVKKDFLKRRVTVVVGQRVEALRWQTGGKRYSVDGTGKIIKELGEGEAAKAPLVIDASSLPASPNHLVSTSEFVNFVITSNQALAAITSLNPTQNRIAESTIELLVDTDKGFYIRFDTSRDLDEQLAEVRAVMAKEMPREYIDVRLPYKAYYR